MQEAQIIGDLFLPADQQSPGTVEPGMSSFDFPTPSFTATVLWLRGLVGLVRNVRRIASLAYFAVHRFARVAFVQAKMLRFFRRGLGAFDGDGVERGGDHFLVRHIGAFDGDGQRHATAIDQRRTLDAQFAAIGRVFPGFFPHPAATWSSPRPYSAISNRRLSSHRTRIRRVPTAPRTRPAPPTLENTHGWRYRNQTAGASPSTDSPSPTHTGCRRRHSASATVGGPLCNSICKWGSPGRSVPISQFVCGSVHGREFYGIIGPDFDNSSLPDAVWLTPDERESSQLPMSSTLISETGDGGYYAIDNSLKTADGESPVAEWWPSCRAQNNGRTVADDPDHFCCNR